MKGTSRGGGCFRSVRSSELCPNCGEVRLVAHVPIRMAGVYCGGCCPVREDLLRPSRGQK